VRGPSANHDGRATLNLAARVALYALLTILVVASFTVTPERRATPSEPTVAAARAAPADRSFSRSARAYLFEASLEAARQVARVQVNSVDADLIALVIESAPSTEATTEPANESTPEPRPAAAPAPVPARPAATPRAPAPISNPAIADAEARMLALMNASRASAGLASLAMDWGVAAVARAHSAAEASVRYVYHDGIDGTAASRDSAACGSGWYGENTGKASGGNVDALHYEFMSGPWAPINHRTNIMDPNFRRVGVGAVVGADAMYVTVVFCR
jgi:uncharacterized protein YkwD